MRASLKWPCITLLALELTSEVVSQEGNPSWDQLTLKGQHA